MDAAKAAINSPLLELSIDGAKGVLFNVSGSNDLTMLEINEAANVITESIDPNAKVIFGAVIDDSIRKGEVHVTVIATGFDAEKVNESPMAKMSRLTRDAHKKKEDEEKESSNIIFPSKKLESKMIIEEKVQPKGIAARGDFKDLEDDEDELEIPAFIRRKMGK